MNKTKLSKWQNHPDDFVKAESQTWTIFGKALANCNKYLLQRPK